MFIAAQVPAKSQSMGQLQRTRKSHYCVEIRYPRPHWLLENVLIWYFRLFTRSNKFYRDQEQLKDFDNPSIQQPAVRLILLNVTIKRLRIQNM